jgi:hypothetical protein
MSLQITKVECEGKELFRTSSGTLYDKYCNKFENNLNSSAYTNKEQTNTEQTNKEQTNKEQTNTEQTNKELTMAINANELFNQFCATLFEDVVKNFSGKEFTTEDLVKNYIGEGVVKVKKSKKSSKPKKPRKVTARNMFSADPDVKEKIKAESSKLKAAGQPGHEFMTVSSKMFSELSEEEVQKYNKLAEEKNKENGITVSE